MREYDALIKHKQNVVVPIPWYLWGRTDYKKRSKGGLYASVRLRTSMIRTLNCLSKLNTVLIGFCSRIALRVTLVHEISHARAASELGIAVKKATCQHARDFIITWNGNSCHRAA